MRSSYNIINGSNVVSDGCKNIITEFHEKVKSQQNKLADGNSKAIIESYDNLANTIIEGARKKRDEILSSAYNDLDSIKKDAYNKAYADGQKKGYDDAYNKAYEEGYKKNLDKALKEAEIIKNNTDNMIKTVIEQKDTYLKEKESIIKNLIMDCIENVLKREVKDKDSLNNVVFEALSEVKNTKVFVIKAKSMYCSEFKDKVDFLKEQIPFKGDVFIVPDDSMEDGTVIIERDNGKMKFGVDIAFKKIKELFKNED
ncbi:flagellar assembly protein FliH [Clostridium fermenticellae]|uniref:Flagellar assembly protein FliH n=1 Tax=Clostridium fermenticellae TaxID=2068654 RepID=A0A386H4Z0_9CLOT|nr:flagellar assembly protein FliH [Clostridium fermenticellae]AYD40684.1 flagellar assembly protein FliH [Clostridium fermenticellae]